MKRGRKKLAEKMQQISVFLPSELYKKLYDEAQKEYITMAQIIRQKVSKLYE